MSIKWACPRQGETITDAAVHFVWSAVPDTKEYRVQYGLSPDFEGGFDVRVEPIDPECRWGVLLPEDGMLPGEGRVYARVSADGGEWSETLEFTVDVSHPHAPVKRVIDREHPYFMIMDYSQHEWRAPWDLLPEELKPYTSIGGGFMTAGGGSDTLRDALMERDAMGIPWHLYVYGPHESDGGKYSCVPLADCEYLLAHTKNLISVNMVEQYLGRRPDSYHHAVYMRRLITLCGKYGMQFVYSDGNRNNMEMTGFFNSETARVMKEYAPYCSVQFKQNHSHAAYTVYGALLGAWQSGICGNIGVQAENWYWNDAGYRGEMAESSGYLQGIEQLIPYPFSVEMILTGVSIGGTVYTLEGQGWLLECEDGKRPRFSRHGTGILTLFRFLVENRAIPSKDDVFANVNAMLDTKLGSVEQGDAWTGGVWRNAYAPSFPGADPYALFMKESRYYYLPIANRFTKTDLPVFTAEDITDADAFRKTLDGLYPARFGGDCYITRTGSTLIVMNSRENTLAGQTYDIPDICGARGITGGLTTWQYMILSVCGEKAMLLADGPENSEIALTLRSGSAPVRFDGNEGSVTASSGGTVIHIVPCGSPVRAAIGEGEALSPRIVPESHPEWKWLSELPASRVVSGGGVPVKDGCANLRYGKMPLYMNGMTYAHGIGMTDGMEVSYRVDGKYRGLALHYGYDIDAWMPVLLDRDRIVWDRYPHKVELVFRILGDGRELYASPVMRNTYVGKRVCLDIAGVKELTLSLTGRVYRRDENDMVCFDIINPRLLDDAEYEEQLQVKDPGGMIDAAFAEDLSENFRPQVQDSSDVTGKMKFYYLNEKPE